MADEQLPVAPGAEAIFTRAEELEGDGDAATVALNCLLLAFLERHGPMARDLGVDPDALLADVRERVRKGDLGVKLQRDELLRSAAEFAAARGGSKIVERDVGGLLIEQAPACRESATGDGRAAGRRDGRRPGRRRGRGGRSATSRSRPPADAAARPARPRPHASGGRGQARAARRSRARAPAHRRDPLPGDEAQPRPPGTGRRGQDGHRRGLRAAHRRRLRARDAAATCASWRSRSGAW